MGFIKRLKSSYYIPGVDENRARDLCKRVFYRRVPEFPRTVQIQTQTGCNGRCVFCPYKDSYTKVPKGKMSDELFERIVAEIAQFGMTRRVSPYLMNEPFLDKTMIDKARYIRERVRGCKVVVTTNGGVLDKDAVDDIVKDNPFRTIYVSVQGIEKGPYEETTGGGLVFEKTKANVEYLIEQKHKHLTHLNIVVTMIKTSTIDAEAAVRYWKSLGVSSKFTVLENRGGNLADFDRLNIGQKRQFLNCTRLFKHAYIMFNGDMVLCCTDYFKTMVLGNVGDSSIHDVWNSPRAVTIRRDFLRGDLRNNPLCAQCVISDHTE